MRPLLTLSARWTAIVSVAVLTLGLLAGLVRLLPWLVAPDVPFAVARPFAERLGRAALDVAVLVGVPVGVSVAAALFVESGQSRALMSLGVSPGRLLRSVSVVSLVFSSLAVIAGFARWGAEPAASFAARLIESGRSSCASATGRSRVDVPFARGGWVCFRALPRFSGRVPGLRGDFLFSTSSVQSSQDASAVELQGLRLTGRADRTQPLLHVRVRSARVYGLFGEAKTGSRTFGALRGLAISASAALSALALSWVILRHSVSRPLSAACAACAVALCLLFALRYADERAFGAALPLALRGDR